MSTLKRKIATRRPPPGIDLVRETIQQYEEQLRDAVNEDHSGKRKNELTWRITRLHWEKSRYVYDLFWRKKAISRELYEWLGREKVVDMPLMKQWRKQGYEKLCSLQAISTQNTNFGTTSICRIPLHKRHHAQLAPAATTGCVSCCSSDKGAPIWWNTPLPDEDELEAEAPGAAAEAAGAGKRKASEADVEDELDEETAKRLKALQGL
mmetsp:Transcript_9593/g.39439  ORF Transcript_9593/g.39439 Transcript_9593/m.39439 type:complete len:208 (-) Transcript_9593:58-681(-)|eukprot:PRCOL_00006389-RA